MSLHYSGPFGIASRSGGAGMGSLHSGGGVVAFGGPAMIGGAPCAGLGAGGGSGGGTVGLGGPKMRVTIAAAAATASSALHRVRHRSRTSPVVFCASVNGAFSETPKRLITTKSNVHSNTVHSKTYKEDETAVMIDLDESADLIEIDTGTCVARCGAKVTMESLVNASLSLGLRPLCVPELRDITVGGAVMGAALESTSHRHGQFADTCAWVLLRLGDGTQRTVTPADPEFLDISGSYGTLCTLLEAGVRCCHTSSMVCVSYQLVEQKTDQPAGHGVCALIDAAEGSDTSLTFLDGLHLPAGWDGRNSLAATVIITGVTSEQATHELEDASWRSSRHGEWYFEHVIKVARRLRQKHPTTQDGETFSECMPLEHYLFRYDFGAFWMARPLRWSWREAVRLKYGIPLLGLFLTSSPFLRPLLGFLYSTRKLFRLLHSAPLPSVNRTLVIADFYIPSEKAAGFVSTVRREVPISTPLWLCPVRAPPKLQCVAPHGHCRAGSLLINVGIYGRVFDRRGCFYTALLENACIQAGGRKMLYSAHMYSRDQFEAIYDAAGDYTAARKRWDADGNFPHLFDKVCRDANTRGKWGAFAEAVADALL